MKGARDYTANNTLSSIQRATEPFWKAGPKTASIGATGPSPAELQVNVIAEELTAHLSPGERSAFARCLELAVYRWCLARQMRGVFSVVASLTVARRAIYVPLTPKGPSPDGTGWMFYAETGVWY